MNDIIKILENEHNLIVQAIAAIKNLSDSCLPGRQACIANTEILANLERLVLNHISKEDSEIYIPFKKMIKMTPKAEKFLTSSRQSLEDIKIQALIFFEKYKGDSNQSMCSGFKADFLRLSDRLDKRMDFENNELFPFLTDLWDNFFK